MLTRQQKRWQRLVRALCPRITQEPKLKQMAVHSYEARAHQHCIGSPGSKPSRLFGLLPSKEKFNQGGGRRALRRCRRTRCGRRAPATRRPPASAQEAPWRHRLDAPRSFFTSVWMRSKARGTLFVVGDRKLVLGLLLGSRKTVPCTGAGWYRAYPQQRPENSSAGTHTIWHPPWRSSSRITRFLRTETQYWRTSTLATL